ncbi:hypothetical protein [Chitinophaga polysaccharea]|uniref:hypothetical protein n=1 Tax=Chitinophaga polysaccharea TaxID=1293035 RepID=UPI0011584323|nr:hypothetical protein [Chitinophaga polysaccharea]
MSEILEELSFSNSQLNVIYYKAKEKLDEAMKNRKAMLIAKQKEVKDIEVKIEEVEERLMNKEIEPATYKKWYNKLSAAKSVLFHEIEKLSSHINEKMSRLEKAIPYLCNLKTLYESLGLMGKQKLLNGVFKANLIFTGEQLRTPLPHPALMCNYLKTNKKGLLFVEQPSSNLGESPIRSEIGTITYLIANILILL